MQQYDCLIVGAGFAGLQAAIQLGRYNRNVAVVDAGEGRSALCGNYHNLIGWPAGVSGPDLRKSGRLQAERLGVTFIEAVATTAERRQNGFSVTTDKEGTLYAKRLLLATGLKDRIPDFPAIYPCLGVSIYVCPDCDGYEVTGRKTVVLGSGNPGANMALTLAYFTQDLIYINHEQAPVEEPVLAKLAEQGIRYMETPIAEVMTEDTEFKGVTLADGTEIYSDRAFVAFGGNEVRSLLAAQLGAELMDNRHLIVDPRTKLTTAEHVWAAGDVVGHSEMVTIAMGDGSQAAIWIHKSLL
jgi:thioredoxin reductase (NADPH)